MSYVAYIVVIRQTKGNQMKAYSIRLTDEMMERLQQEARDMEMTPSDLIRRLLNIAIKDHLS